MSEAAHYDPEISIIGNEEDVQAESWGEWLQRKSTDIEAYLAKTAKSSVVIRFALFIALLIEMNLGMRSEDNELLNPRYWATTINGTLDQLLYERVQKDLIHAKEFVQNLQYEHSFGPSENATDAQLYPNDQFPSCKDLVSKIKKYGIAYTFFFALDLACALVKMSSQAHTALKYANQEHMSFFKKYGIAMLSPFMIFKRDKDSEGRIHFTRWDVSPILLAKALGLIADCTVIAGVFNHAMLRKAYYQFIGKNFGYYTETKRYGNPLARIAAREDAGGLSLLTNTTISIAFLLLADNPAGLAAFLTISGFFIAGSWALEYYQRRRESAVKEVNEMSSLVNR